MEPRCKHCTRPYSRCICNHEPTASSFYESWSDDTNLLHIGGTWSPSHHSAISPSAVRSALRKPVVGGGEDA
jgi:hypothetical protein